MKAKLPFLFGLLAVWVLVVGTAFALSKTLPRMSNRPSRFVLLFLVCVPLGFAYDYVKHWALGYHRSAMSGPVAVIWALLWAALFTFWGPRSHNE